MNYSLPELAAHFADLLTREADELAIANGKGASTSWEDYHRRVGTVKGLTLAAEKIQDAARRLYKDEDDIEDND